MRIRPARADEAQNLADIAWSAKSFWPYASDQLEAWRDALTPSVASINKHPTLIAERDHTAIGFCQIDLTTSPPQLEHLWVLPSCMGQGAGTALLARALQHLFTQGLTQLHIDADPNAESFYRRCGAQRVGETAAPIAGQANRIRPQMRLSATAFAALTAHRATQHTNAHPEPDPI